MSIDDAALSEYARRIDPDRAAELAGEFRPMTALLSVAYPAMTPVHSWQRELLDELDSVGWHAGHDTTQLMQWLPEQEDQAVTLRQLRRMSWGQRARIALRELLPPALGGAPIETTARELSQLADVTVQVALDEALRHIARRYGEPKTSDGKTARMVVLGMGKLGGYELNAGSDVDLIFLNDTDSGGSEISLHDHFTRVGRRLTRTLEDVTEDGFVWRVDLRLRPEGSQGPIVNSIAAAERYYEAWGRTWERAALLRARPMAGDIALGRRFQAEVVAPFVFRRTVDPSIATTLSRLVEQSRLELSTDDDRDLKHGVGGLREAEFFVQALQLIWGGREPTLRVQSMQDGLLRLHSRGFATDREVHEIAGAYWLLRRTEHAVQWSTGLQTHSLPTDDDDLERLARAMDLGTAGDLLERLGRARDAIHTHFLSVLPESADDAQPSPHQYVLAQLDRGGRALDVAVAEVYGHSEVAEHLHAMAKRPNGPLGAISRERSPALTETLLDAIADAADPEQAARYLRSFFGRFVNFGSYLEAFYREPRAIARMTAAFGASAFVGDQMVAYPDLAAVFFVSSTAISPEAIRSVVQLEVDAARRASRKDDIHAARDALIGALRRAKSRCMLNVAVSDLASEVTTDEATRLLSALADEQLERATEFELGGARGLAVIAMGKLGGEEIGYGSDLDVVFVYDPNAAPAGEDGAEFYSRRAQRIIRLISMSHPAGKGYELDTRLRPSGSHGLLVTSVDAFERYHGLLESGQSPRVQSSGAAWERQALLRARFSAGDRQVGARVIQLAARAAYGGGAPAASEIHHLRMRMQKELATEREGLFDLKFGRGGLLDIEFCIQWLQLRHGRELTVYATRTLDALESLESAGVLTEQQTRMLREAYDFLRRLEQRMHVQTGTSQSVLDSNHPGIAGLARRFGFRDSTSGTAGARLIERYQAVTTRVRAMYLEVLGLPDDG